MYREYRPKAGDSIETVLEVFELKARASRHL